jgi:hypothetical protein
MRWLKAEAAVLGMARSAGLSWPQISRAMGLASAQAAQQRSGAGPGPRGEPRECVTLRACPPGAPGQVDQGHRAWVDAPDRDSCHILWIQFHEDLLATLGVPRGSDA